MILKKNDVAVLCLVKTNEAVDSYVQAHNLDRSSDLQSRVIGFRASLGGIDEVALAIENAISSVLYLTGIIKKPEEIPAQLLGQEKAMEIICHLMQRMG